MTSYLTSYLTAARRARPELLLPNKTLQYILQEVHNCCEQIRNVCSSREQAVTTGARCRRIDRPVIPSIGDDWSWSGSAPIHPRGAGS